MIVRLLCVSSLVAVAYSVSFQIQPIREILPDGSTLLSCEYQGFQILQGSWFRTRDCYDCSFDSDHCICDGFGIKAGHFGPPPGCKVIPNGCDLLFVRVDNETLDCETGNPIG